MLFAIKLTKEEIKKFMEQAKTLAAQNGTVFTDKIARHPEQLGVRGALDRGPGLK